MEDKKLTPPEEEFVAILVFFERHALYQVDTKGWHEDDIEAHAQTIERTEVILRKVGAPQILRDFAAQSPEIMEWMGQWDIEDT